MRGDLVSHRTRRGIRSASVRLARATVVEGLEERRLFSTAYALLGTAGTVLARFDTATPEQIDSTKAVTGLGSGTQLRGIDFRPSTGELYALGIRPTSGDDEGYIFKINTSTGAATMLGAGAFSTSLSSAAPYGFDFNPAVDRIRIFNGDDQNLRVNPFTGFLVQFDTPLDNPADDEEVTGGAYDRNVSDVMPIGTPQALTTLFGIDFINDTLVRIGGVDGGAPEGSPNNGVVTEVGPLGITTGSSANGFDIGQDGTAFAVLTDADTGLTSLYTIDLTTGEATQVGEINNGAELVRGFALAPDDLPPIAAPDTYQVAAGGTLTVNPRGVLSNDIDPDGPDADLTAELISGPTTSQGGTVTLNPNGSFTYTPPAGFIGTDSFSYVANDGTSDSTVTTVTLNVVPQFTINDKATFEGNSGTKVLTFTVSLSAPAPAGGATVNYNTQNNTAGEGDYGVKSGSLSFAAGETSKTIDITIKGDTKSESDETFFVRLTNANGATIGDDRGVGTILNDDAAPTPTPTPSPTPTVFIDINNESNFEGNSGTRLITFKVWLDKTSTKQVKVNFATSNGTAGSGDYNATGGTLTFNPGQTQKTVSVTIKGDTKVEGNETFFVNLSNAVNASIGKAKGTGTILNDD